MDNLKLYYTPQFDQDTIEQDLHALLVPGALTDRDLERRIVRLGERYRIYTAYYCHGLWAPGLAVTQEMRNLTELYLTFDEIRRAFDRFFAITLQFSPFHGASTIHNESGWLDIQRNMQPIMKSPDPASLLRRLLIDEELRRCFIFANFMPSRYGGGFGRYPWQREFLRGWLRGNHSRLSGRVRCLDAACGSGEGVYELARLLIECGFGLDSIQVDGVTLEPLELFAAAHCYFPHDPPRTAAYRLYVDRLAACGVAEKISFTLADLTGQGFAVEKEHDVILCNGLLGGPFLHDTRDLRETVQKLVGRLGSGGILMAANRFHGGWKKLVNDEMLRMILAECGLRIMPVVGGVAGQKSMKYEG